MEKYEVNATFQFVLQRGKEQYCQFSFDRYNYADQLCQNKMRPQVACCVQYTIILTFFCIATLCHVFADYKGQYCDHHHIRRSALKKDHKYIRSCNLPSKSLSSIVFPSHYHPNGKVIMANREIVVGTVSTFNYTQKKYRS